MWQQASQVNSQTGRQMHRQTQIPTMLASWVNTHTHIHTHTHTQIHNTQASGVKSLYFKDFAHEMGFHRQFRGFWGLEPTFWFGVCAVTVHGRSSSLHRECCPQTTGSTLSPLQFSEFITSMSASQAKCVATELFLHIIMCYFSPGPRNFNRLC